MFGRKKKDLPVEARMMHYEGLPGFLQDGPCFMEQTEAGLVFRQANGPAATLPLEKVTGLEMMPERNFMARYHGTAATTAHGKAVKWFAVFHYAAQDGERMLAFGGSILKQGPSYKNLLCRSERKRKTTLCKAKKKPERIKTSPALCLNLENLFQFLFPALSQ